MKFLPRAGLFAMIAGAGITPFFLPNTDMTLAMISTAIAALIAGFIVYDRWIKS